MGMSPNLVLNQTNFKFFVKVMRTRGFKNSRNFFQDRTEGSINKFKKKKVRTQVKGSF
jgi:hypothetical protein